MTCKKDAHIVKMLLQNRMEEEEYKDIYAPIAVNLFPQKEDQ